MANKVSIDGLADAVMKELNEYKDLSTEDMKKDVRKAAQTVKKDIQANAPRKSGKYAKSWSIKTDKETSETLALIVHSRNKYQLAHLPEKGHAKRGGGRTAAQPHIAPAEEHGAEELESLIRRDLSKNG